MSRRWAGWIFGFVGGLLAGVLLDIGRISTSYSSAWATYWKWWGEFASDARAELLIYPIGAALAGFLAASGLIRWRTPFSSIVVVAVSSLIGAIVSVPGSVLFDCVYWGYSNMGCSGLGALRLTVEAPMTWIALAVVATILGLLARWIAGPGYRTPSEQRA